MNTVLANSQASASVTTISAIAGQSSVDFPAMSVPTATRITSESITVSTSRSEEHTSELQSLMRISYAVFCLKKKMNKKKPMYINQHTNNKHDLQHSRNTLLKEC